MRSHHAQGAAPETAGRCGRGVWSVEPPVEDTPCLWVERRAEWRVGPVFSPRASTAGYLGDDGPRRRRHHLQRLAWLSVPPRREPVMMMGDRSPKDKDKGKKQDTVQKGKAKAEADAKQAPKAPAGKAPPGKR